MASSMKIRSNTENTAQAEPITTEQIPAIVVNVVIVVLVIVIVALVILYCKYCRTHFCDLFSRNSSWDIEKGEDAQKPFLQRHLATLLRWKKLIVTEQAIEYVPRQTAPMTEMASPTPVQHNVDVMRMDASMEGPLPRNAEQRSVNNIGRSAPPPVHSPYRWDNHRWENPYTKRDFD